MESSFFLKGMVLGFSIAAPVGPIGILCIRRTLQFGRFSGFFSGLGAALADSIFGSIAGFGLTLISDFLTAGKMWFHLIGAFFLLYLGAKTFCSKTHDIAITRVTHKTLFNDFLSAFFLTMTNPLTILAFFAVFAGLGLSNETEENFDAVPLVAGIFFGSVLWWWLLSEGVTFFRKKISEKVMKWVNRLAGLVIMSLGLMAFLSVVILWLS